MKFTEGGFKRWGYEVAETEFAEQTFTMNQYEQLKKDLGEESAKAELAKAVNGGKYLADSGRIFGHRYIELERRLHFRSVGCHGRWYRYCSGRQYQLPDRTCHF